MRIISFCAIIAFLLSGCVTNPGEQNFQDVFIQANRGPVADQKYLSAFWNDLEGPNRGSCRYQDTWRNPEKYGSYIFFRIRCDLPICDLETVEVGGKTVKAFAENFVYEKKKTPLTLVGPIMIDYNAALTVSEMDRLARGDRLVIKFTQECKMRTNAYLQGFSDKHPLKGYSIKFDGEMIKKMKQYMSTQNTET